MTTTSIPRAQHQILDQFLPLLSAAVKAHSAFDITPTVAPFVIADFGCSTGLNSSDAISHIIDKVRERYGFNRCPTVLVVLDDLPRNCWSELFGFLHSDERSFLHRHQGVYTLSSGRTFYEQIMPDNSLQIGISSVCIHWCSRLPVKIADHCMSVFASADERELFKQVAEEDWTNFLKARSKELVKGGVLALTVASPHQNCDAIFDEIHVAAKTLQQRGTIDKEELLNFNIRMHFRSVEEVSDKAVYESLGLELLAAEVFPSEHSVFYRDYLEHRNSGRFALDWTNTVLAFLEPTFRDALSAVKTEEEKKLACSELMKEYTMRLAANPDRVSDVWGMIGVLIRKK